jgi:type I restriction enzyme, S subunit
VSILGELGSVADVNWGDTSVTKASYVDRGFVAFSATGPDGFLPYADFNREGIVLSAIGAQCGKTWFATGQWSCIKNTIRFWSEDETVLQNRYLYWLTAEQSFWPRRGAAQPFITIGDARKLKIAIPSVEKQRRIAAVLDQADDLRRKRRVALEQLEALLQVDFFSTFCRRPGLNWPEVSVADISKSIRTGPFGSQLLHSEFIHDGVAVLGIDNAVRNEFRWDERRYISEAKYRGLQRYRVFPRDLLITIMGTCGRAAIVPDNIPLAINTKHLCCLTLDENRCLPEFLHACFLRHPSVLHQLGVRERGAVMAGLNMALIKETKLSLPPLDLQRAFAARVAEIDMLKERHRAHLAKLDALFASLQQRAFRGDL